MLGQMSPWSGRVTKPRRRALLSSMNAASHALGFAQRVDTKHADEQRLVRAAKDDPAVFGEIYLAHVDAVFGYLVRRTGNRAVAEDLSADTFERALAALERFEWRGAPLRAWLLRIADRAATDWFRQRTRRPALALVDDRDLAVVPSAEVMAMTRSRDEAVYRALNELSVAQRLVVLLHLGEGLTHAEIARRLKRRDGAIRMLYIRGLRRMKEQLTDDDV